MIILWLIVSVIVGVLVYHSSGCAAAFGAMVCCLFLVFLLAAIASC